MVPASELKEGMIIKREEKLYKVMEVETKARTAQFSSYTHLKLQDLKTGHIYDIRVSPDEKIENVDIEEIEMEYSYSDGENFYFIHPDTFEIIELPSYTIGDFKKFMKEGIKLKIQIYEGNPISVLIPEYVELKVITTGEGLKGGTDNTWKSATLENGMEILVPQFIKEGDIIRVSTKTGEYLERVHK
ncbi:MAG: elongation factor P [Candidatus Omnitrophica bacterium]|nr:elongation factor P [Candidatus Omnitrophota bacterium]MCM8806592.1 elongation factor P [Candidatus Omnitrophota bacterium]